jgi:hypothetical protein
VIEHDEAALAAAQAAKARAVMRYFNYAHLAAGAQQISKLYHDAAAATLASCPDNDERRHAIERLLEAKDAAVRSFLFP